ncbi:metallophosphoesterase family protein [Calorimonas adulescens]|jgi:phosphoesterase, MJ0936 family|uniref:Phosphoesterase n=1 Tax=Calorimonas adulescens TaxID=2606906 RepID=A0A5D8QDX6_9THEO|nr:metallophosphoesterase [Calorimonas adulescens]TZE81713.1 metallophosphoesterase [Calorimonas adulescens]
MRIGIISDTHRLWGRIEEALRTMGKVDMILHLGDNVSDAEDIRNILRDIPVVAVKGNCDSTDNLPEERTLLLEGRKIFMTHGHRYNVKYDFSDIYKRAKEVEADIALFGHSHLPIILRKSDIIFINPGSTSMPKHGSSPSCAILTIEDNRIDARLLTVSKSIAMAE